jgi:WD40-like Beta Propeller Repeat
VPEELEIVRIGVLSSAHQDRNLSGTSALWVFMGWKPLLILSFAGLVACGHHDGGGGVDATGGPGNPVIVPCAGCMMFPPFTGPGSVGACSDPATDPTLVYPPDQVLLPPNMNVIEVQFSPGANNTLFEIDFENASTDVRFETMCNAITNTRGTATGGCSFDLDPTDWNYVATLNRGGDPVTVTVRGVPADLSCVAGSNSRTINYAQEDLSGGIYYWQSVTQGGVAGTTGGIFRKDFGNPDPTPEPFLTPGNLNKCVGCHYLSRDGQKMVFGDDDADSDDELGDDTFVLYDVTTRTATMLSGMTKGFAAWRGSDHADFALSLGTGMGMGGSTPELLQFDGSSGAAGTTVSFSTVAALAGLRVTNPDWTRDGTMVYFTATTPITGITSAQGTYNNKDDIHATHGSLWSVPVTAGTFRTPTPLVTPASLDENDYYPAISPDGSVLVFDRATGTTLATHDSYNNPNATLFGMAVPSGTPVALAKANLHDTLTNSWPRWSPAVQMYKGKRIVWMTFSSTRDYGLRVANEAAQFFNCYPPVSPENPSNDHKQAFDPNCTQPQIWMAAVSLDDLAANTDGSFPAFWLPFQDFTAHNHIAQWVDSIVNPTCTMGTQGQACSTTNPCCNGFTCDTTSMTCQNLIP